jgi:hypothetical protein
MSLFNLCTRNSCFAMSSSAPSPGPVPWGLVAAVAAGVGAVLCAAVVHSKRVRKLRVWRVPFKAPDDDAHSDLTSVGTVDIAWARSNGFLPIEDYVRSLRMDASARESGRWRKEALMSFASAHGLPDGPPAVLVGLVLNAMPDGYLPHLAPLESLLRAAATASLPYSAMVAVAQVVGAPSNGKSSEGGLNLLRVGGTLPTPDQSWQELSVKMKIVLPRDLQLAEQHLFGASAGGIADDADQVSREATPISELLPGLCHGTGGLKPRWTPRQVFYNRFCELVLNRVRRSSDRALPWQCSIWCAHALAIVDADRVPACSCFALCWLTFLGRTAGPLMHRDSR